MLWTSQEAVGRRDLLKGALGLMMGGVSNFSHGVTSDASNPVRIAVDAEFTQAASTSAQAILAGVAIAAMEVNLQGGVLGGRRLEVLSRDNRAVPSRALENLSELAAMKDLVAVFCGKFSPVAIEAVPLVHKERLIYLDPWAAVDGIVQNGYSPNYVFRLSLTDSWAVDAMLHALQQRQLFSFNVILPNTAWGRSCLLAIQNRMKKYYRFRIIQSQWYNWGERNFAHSLRFNHQDKPDAFVFIGNQSEAALFLNEMARLPSESHLPIVSHHGVTGGDLFNMAGGSITKLDFSFVQTYSREKVESRHGRVIATQARKILGLADNAPIPSHCGLVHAYDLCHLLVRAIERARSTSRVSVRNAFEKLGPYTGLLKYYSTPFTTERHEALSRNEAFMAKFNGAGYVVRDARV